MTAIISNGKAIPVEAKSYPLPVTPAVASIFMPRGHGFVDLLRGDGLAATFRAMYETQPTIAAVVNKIVLGISRNPLRNYEVDSVGNRIETRAHPSSVLLRRPTSSLTGTQLIAETALDLHINGHALWIKGRPGVGAPPNEVYPIRWERVNVIEDESGILAYLIISGLQRLIVPPEDVVHFRLPGGSPMQALRRSLALEDAAITYMSETLRKGMGERGAFIAEGRIPDAVYERTRQEIGKLYEGVHNAGRTALLEGNLRFEKIGMSPVDAELLAQRKLGREEVCAAYDVHPSLVGIVEKGGSYGSVAEYRRALYDAIAMKLVLIEDTINHQLIEAEPSWDGISVAFDTNELLRPDPEARAQQHMLLLQAGVETRNEARRIEGLPPIEDPRADTIFVPVNMQPLGVEQPTDGSSPAGTPAQGLGQRIISDATTVASANDLAIEIMREGTRP